MRRRWVSHNRGQPGVPVRLGLLTLALLTRSVPTPQANRLEKAVAAAYTFLQRNPKHELTAKYLSYYRGLLDAAEEPLTDLEAQPYEVGWRGTLALTLLPAPCPIGLVKEGRCWGVGRDPLISCHTSLQAVFLRAVKFYNSGDFRSSSEDMERALAEYLAVFARCLAGCEGAQEQVDFKDFYPAIAGIHTVPTRLWRSSL